MANGTFASFASVRRSPTALLRPSGGWCADVRSNDIFTATKSTKRIHSASKLLDGKD